MMRVAPVVLAVLLAPAALAEEPPLPAGMESLGDEPSADSDDDAPLPIELRGFFDSRIGVRTAHTLLASPASLAEHRLQLAVSGAWPAFAFGATVDFVYDLVLDDHEPDLETGQGAIDPRELYLVVTPTPELDLKIGRQILTWGTGDLVFINDLFPKDWTAFLIGRDVSYLKAPSDAARLALYSEVADVDLVFTPRFDADRFPDRRRIVSWDPLLGRLAGDDAVPRVRYPDRWFEDVEVAARVRRAFGPWEVALYGYYGFFKSPSGVALVDPGDPSQVELTFPALASYGASVRGPLAGGILNVEAGHYLSLDDPDHDDPLVANGEVRALVGYEHELAQDLVGSVQYYLEAVLDDDERHVVTMRLTWRALRQSLVLSLFAFFSPSELDAHLRPHVAYAVDDHWRLEVGASLFVGADEDTFYGQFGDDSNVYFGLRGAW